jgi:hypothetical protein
MMEDQKHVETEYEDNIDPTEGTSVPSKRPEMSYATGIPRKRAKTIEGPMATLQSMTMGGMPMAMDPLCASLS